MTGNLETISGTAREIALSTTIAIFGVIHFLIAETAELLAVRTGDNGLHADTS